MILLDLLSFKNKINVVFTLIMRRRKRDIDEHAIDGWRKLWAKEGYD